MRAEYLTGGRVKKYQYEIEAERIAAGKCPACGDGVKDKGGYMRCFSCPFCITNGTWNEEEGWCIETEPLYGRPPFVGDAQPMEP
jgi:hypothetical protein